ncbi:TerB family tellurite resistance protein [Mucilaginibacter sp. RS28]|uniref:TerB family tellurite resistance protein n=1 Tax=Mucilaginibacter straminoryzae TaxID=2932774 RepID=A0A9X2B9U9_9SPHI|nr:TerB family tellurite resistance protein [Mucilaginibacter straminoryzae]MCJ8208112.1 TerB family tellurite resistance protein [Mucilaginibacter straminoryzae]
MKKMIKPLLGSMMILLVSVTVQAQSIADNIQMLVLDYQKLAGLKKVLSNMYSGYQLVSKGYNSVKDVSQGNFSLQQGFIDGLMLVSPTVRKYPKVARIISDQATIASEYKSALSSFRSDGHFTASELNYVATVFSNLSDQSVQNLQALTMVITDGSVRMSDDQRLRLIDGIYADTQHQLSFLRSFNNQARTLALRRADSEVQRQQLKQLYDLN